jgi:predicted N-acetyltransferase YhbS
MHTHFESDVVGRPQPMVRDESRVDEPAVDALLRAAFGRSDEADAVQARRGAEVPGSRSLVAVISNHAPGDDMASLGTGQVVGYLHLTPGHTDDGEVLALSLVAVLPENQRMGVGTYLVQFALEMTADTGGVPVVIPDDIPNGPDAPFWDRFGLRRSTTQR